MQFNDNVIWPQTSVLDVYIYVYAKIKYSKALITK